MSETAVLRRFNRTWSQRVGALDESFLGLGMPLREARLLFEIGADGESAAVGDLRARLGLDSGHLSRLLRALEERALVEVAPDPGDRRRRLARTTVAGRRTLADLERRSEERAHALLDPLTAVQRERLAAALRTADLLVRAATVAVEEVPADDPRARAAVGRYVEELRARFPVGFDPGSPDAAGRYLVATSDGATVACGGVRQIAPGVGEVKRMWVDDAWRGAGLGRRLLGELEALAGRLGHARVRLDTNGTLSEAIALYERAGYRRIERYNDNPHAELWFEKEL